MTHRSVYILPTFIERTKIPWNIIFIVFSLPKYFYSLTLIVYKQQNIHILRRRKKNKIYKYSFLIEITLFHNFS